MAQPQPTEENPNSLLAKTLDGGQFKFEIDVFPAAKNESADLEL